MTKDAYYFPHDSNAKDDPKCVLLIEQLGLEGYGIYWVLVETLRDQPNYKYPFRLVPAIARKYNTTVEKVVSVIKNYELFHTDEENFFFSHSLVKRMQLYESNKMNRLLKAKNAANKRWNAQAMLKQCSSNAQAMLSDAKIVEYSKVNNSKVNESKEDDIKKTTLAGNEKVIFDFPSSSFKNLNSKIEIYKQKFPAVDVEREIGKMEAWLISNPKNRKSNYERFITNWLSRSQDKAPATNEIKFETPEERAKRMAKELEERLCK